MLLYSIIDELNDAARSETPTASPMLSFFCQATDIRINHATAVLRGLIYLLLKQRPALVSHLREKYEHAGKRLFEDVNAWTALSDILANMLCNPAMGPTYLMIDALDECTGNLPQLLNLIVRSSASHIKWIVSSRNWPQIEDQLRTTGHSCSLELNAESVSAAVDIYIQRKVLQLAQQKKYNTRIQDAVQQHLSSNARGTFLWVALVCERLKHVSRHSTLARLDDFPPRLNTIYNQMMVHIRESEEAKLCGQILTLAVVAYQPLSIEEVASLIETLEPSDLESCCELVDLCGSFLTRRDGTVYFVHQSAKDFLLKEHSHTIFPSGTGEAHHVVFSKSLEVLQRTLRRDIYSLLHPGFPIDQVVQRKPDELASARYSCIFWVNHLVAAGSCIKSKDVEDGSDVHAFLSRKYLNWLEALSLLRAMPNGVLAVDKLRCLVQVRLRPSVPSNNTNRSYRIKQKTPNYIFYFRIYDDSSFHIALL